MHGGPRTGLTCTGVVDMARPQISPACLFAEAMLLEVRVATQAAAAVGGGPRTSKAVMDHYCMGAKQGPLQRCQLRMLSRHHSFFLPFLLPSLPPSLPSLHIELLLWVTVQGIWDPREEMVSASVSIEVLTACHLTATCLFISRVPKLKDPF